MGKKTQIMKVFKLKLKLLDIALNNLKAQFLVAKPKEKAKEFSKKVTLSILATIFFHILSQIQGSINKYGITNYRNIWKSEHFV